MLILLIKSNINIRIVKVFSRLSLACEELRIYGHFSKLTEKIEQLPDDLVDLQVEILKRLEGDQHLDELLVATVCLLLVSQSGKTHILQLLEFSTEMSMLYYLTRSPGSGATGASSRAAEFVA